MSLDAALERHQRSAAPGHLLFAREATGGKRSYISMPPAEAWNQTSSAERAHLYEVLSGPCSFYLDVEWISSQKPNNEEQRVEKIAIEAQQLLSKHVGHEPGFTAVTASGDTAKGYKSSWHLHFHTDGVAWSCAASVGDFVKQHLAHIPEIDLAPYKSPTQNWRCVGSCKVAEPNRVLGPCTKETFMACIVHSTARKIIPRQQKPPTSVCVRLPSHARFVASLFAGVRQSAVQMAQESSRFLVLPMAGRQCPIADREHTSNHPYVVVDLACMRWRNACHNAACAANPQPWQAMPYFSACKKLLPPPAPVCVPIKCSDAPDLTVRSRGPPPVAVFSDRVRVVRCCNGTYRLPNAH